MANNCENRIRIVSSNEDIIMQVIHAAQSGTMLQFMAPVDKTGDMCDQVEAQRAAWGTRSEVAVVSIDHSCPGEVIIDCDTPWSPPLRAIQSFWENNPGLDISCEFCEPTEFVGVWRNGEDCHYDIPSTYVGLQAIVPSYLIAEFSLGCYFD
jgi:hypothetical protein